MIGAMWLGSEGLKYGFYNMAGELVIPCIYDRTTAFRCGLARVEIDDAYGYIDKTGKIIIPIEYEASSQECVEDRVWVTKDGLYGCYDTQGDLVIPFQYTAALPFSNGLAVVTREDGKVGAVDYNGTTVIPFEYDNMVSYSEGLCPVKKDGQWGAIDLDGNIIIPFCFDTMGQFSEGLVWVSLGEKYGVLENPYAAVRSDWAAQEIEEAQSIGLLTSRTERWFTKDITRVQFAELMVNLAETVTGTSIDATGVLPFTDTVDRSARQAYVAGLVTGTGDGSTFSSDDLLTREQLATILCRTIRYIETATGKSILTSGDLSTYTDADQVSPWAQEAVSTLSASSIMRGTSATTLSPQAATTVEQAILLALRVYQQF